MVQTDALVTDVWRNEDCLLDLSIVKTVTPSTAAPGETITYTLTFSNAGGVADTGVVITDSVPVSVTSPTVIGSSGAAITLTGSAPHFVWSVANLAQGEGGVITLTGVLSEPLAAGVFTNTAEIACAETESDDTNNSSEAGVTVQDAAPELSVGGTVTYTEDASPVVIAPGLTLTDPNGAGNTLDEARVSISDNFVAGEDYLGIDGQGSATSGTEEGIAWNYNATTGILTLQNTRPISVYESVLRKATYHYNLEQNPTTAARSVGIFVGSGLYFEPNGHFYEFVDDSGICWTDARDAAADCTYFGLQGYLMTVTSAEENGFVTGKLQGKGWMGASDAGHDKQWYWETGPEAATWFFTQNGYNPSGPNTCGTGGSVEPGYYAKLIGIHPRLSLTIGGLLGA